MWAASQKVLIKSGPSSFAQHLCLCPALAVALTGAGLFAAAMSSMDSALNAMASATIADFYRPWRQRRSSALGFPR